MINYRLPSGTVTSARIIMGILFAPTEGRGAEVLRRLVETFRHQRFIREAVWYT
jgi:hypothetical protein